MALSSLDIRKLAKSFAMLVKEETLEERMSEPPYGSVDDRLDQLIRHETVSPQGLFGLRQLSSRIKTIRTISSKARGLAALNLQRLHYVVDTITHQARLAQAVLTDLESLKNLSRRFRDDKEESDEPARNEKAAWFVQHLRWLESHYGADHVAREPVSNALLIDIPEFDLTPFSEPVSFRLMLVIGIDQAASEGNEPYVRVFRRTEDSHAVSIARTAADAVRKGSWGAEPYCVAENPANWAQYHGVRGCDYALEGDTGGEQELRGAHPNVDQDDCGALCIGAHYGDVLAAIMDGRVADAVTAIERLLRNYREGTGFWRMQYIADNAAGYQEEPEPEEEEEPEPEEEEPEYAFTCDYCGEGYSDDPPFLRCADCRTGICINCRRSVIHLGELRYVCTACARGYLRCSACRFHYRLEEAIACEDCEALRCPRCTQLVAGEYVCNLCRAMHGDLVTRGDAEKVLDPAPSHVDAPLVVEPLHELVDPAQVFQNIQPLLASADSDDEEIPEDI